MKYKALIEIEIENPSKSITTITKDLLAFCSIKNSQGVQINESSLKFEFFGVFDAPKNKFDR